MTEEMNVKISAMKITIKRIDGKEIVIKLSDEQRKRVNEAAKKVAAKLADEILNGR